MSNDNALEAFSQAAGISNVDLSLFIRTGLLVGFIMWSAWTALELLKFHKRNSQDNVSRLLSNYIQLFFLITMVIALVFIS